MANASAVRRLSGFVKFYQFYRVVSVRLASGIIAVVLAASLSQASVAAKPNIVFVLADDMGFGDVQALNARSKVPTPNLNRLARQGMV
ncbi:uncharacterized protein METZ01_LOCUS308058, partial [marine metagenome]